MTVIHPPSHVAPSVAEPKPWVTPTTEQQAIEAITASQSANGDSIDPGGARRLVRALIAVGLFKPV
jgi:hypothetical protein